MVPFDIHTYDPGAVKVSTIPKDARSEIPLRAQSVCLSERPRSKYSRTIRSADYRSPYPDKQFIHKPHPEPKPRKYNKVLVKQQNRKLVEKVPCVVSVQTLSIPTKYADHKHSTSKHNSERVDRTKSSNPSKQVSDNKRLCAIAGCGKETENKLLVQICEAQQVSDFQRILNSNAIQRGRLREQVWRGVAPSTSSAALSRPRSAYSLEAISEKYHQLFYQHEESLRPLLEQYRKANAEEHKNCPPVSILKDSLFEHLQNLSEFYQDDEALQEEIESITDKIVSEEIKDIVVEPEVKTAKNFNVNLTGLLELRVNGEGFSPVSHQDGPSPDLEKIVENEAEDKVWGPIMSANNADDANSQKANDTIDCLAHKLKSVNIESDAKVPTITFSNCCDGRGSELPENSAVDVYLAVPSIDSADESRPPL